MLAWTLTRRILPQNIRAETQFHVDFTVAEHLPLFGGIIGIGANGFYYQQVTGDSGSGAQSLGILKAKRLASVPCFPI